MPTDPALRRHWQLSYPLLSFSTTYEYTTHALRLVQALLFARAAAADSLAQRGSTSSW